MSDEPEAVVIRVGRLYARDLVIGGLVVVGIGAAMLVEGVRGNESGDTGWLVAGICVIALGILSTATLASASSDRQARLIVNHLGLQWYDPRNDCWSVPWRELAGVMTCVEERDTLDRHRRSYWVDLLPADPDFADRHPGMRHVRKVEDGYRVPLGAWQHMWRAGQALEQFAPDIYQGFFEDDDLSK